MGRKGKTRGSQDPPPRMGDPQQEDKHNCRVAGSARGPGPAAGPPAWGSCTGRRVLRQFASEGQQGLLLARGLWETETPILKGAHKISHSGTQGRSSHLKGAWVRTTADPREPPEEAGSNWGSQGGQGGSHL